jgi:hypothetical protein
MADHTRIEWARQERSRSRTRKAADEGLQHHEHDRDRDERTAALAQLVQKAHCHEKAIT